jgi:hypothetical protein
MLIVIPSYKSLHPITCRQNVFEALSGILGPIFQYN